MLFLEAACKIGGVLLHRAKFSCAAKQQFYACVVPKRLKVLAPPMGTRKSLQASKVENCHLKVANQIQEHLQTQQMTPEQARKLAGKCSFTTTHLFGKVGRAALRALYDKAFSNNDHLSTHTLSSLTALHNVLQHCSPRRIPLRPTSDQHAIIYTDFFYKDGDRQLRLHQLLEDPDLIKPSSETANRWAAVVFHPRPTKPLAFNGTVPPRLLKHFASNKALIYFLEAWAAIITPVLVQPLLTPTYIQLRDNDPATYAIIKGSGKHMPLNNLLGAHWTWRNRHSLKQNLHGVPTHANIADPFSREDFSIAKHYSGTSSNHRLQAILHTTLAFHKTRSPNNSNTLLFKSSSQDNSSYHEPTNPLKAMDP